MGVTYISLQTYHSSLQVIFSRSYIYTEETESVAIQASSAYRLTHDGRAFDSHLMLCIDHVILAIRKGVAD